MVPSSGASGLFSARGSGRGARVQPRRGAQSVNRGGFARVGAPSPPAGRVRSAAGGTARPGGDRDAAPAPPGCWSRRAARSAGGSGAEAASARERGPDARARGGRGDLARRRLTPPRRPTIHPASGAVAQMGERRVRNAKVRSSILLGSTKYLRYLAHFLRLLVLHLCHSCASEEESWPPLLGEMAGGLPELGRRVTRRQRKHFPTKPLL